MRLTQKFQERMSELEYWLNFKDSDDPYDFDIHVFDSIYNGFHHIVIDETNRIIARGSMCQCYDAMGHLIDGIKFGKGVM